jgi:predicted dehydrogenase
MCGVGSFAECFIPLFKAHPLVSEVILCDLDAAKLKAKSDRFGLPRTCPSLDELCRTDVDAVAIITQHWMHGPQAVQALKAGKHVYSAVPAAVTVDEMTELARAVKTTGRVYMIGETSYYYPCAIYCRRRFAAGDFGHAVYGEGEYYHDFDHGLYDVYKWRGGRQWKKVAGTPPMHYPTHSTSMIVSVTGAHMTSASCLGYVDRHKDGLFRRGVNLFDNVFSNQTALFAMSDGSCARINEFRRVGHIGGERLSLYGTEGSYEQQAGNCVWVHKGGFEDVTAQLACPGRKVKGGTYLETSSVHPVERLPKEFIGLPNGHWGSHQFLVDDFVQACVAGKPTPNNVWQAARYLLPGLVAHESSEQGGKRLPVPDLGDAPGPEGGRRRTT